jgi:hypothetical protein
MEFFLDDPDIQRLPPDEVRLLSIRADPYPDKRRLKVRLETTPFQKPPHLELQLTGPDGNEAGSVSIIEPAAWKMELTMHIRLRGETTGRYVLTASLFYPQGPHAENITYTFEIPAD